jgi:hypothetical protein
VVVTSITLDKTALTLAVNDTAQLTAIVTTDPAGQPVEVEWWSDKQSAVTVSSAGLVTMINGGTTINAKAGGKTASCVVTLEQGSEGAGLYKINDDDSLNAVDDYTHVGLASALTWLGSSTENNINYMILLDTEETISSTQTINITKTGLTVTISGTKKGNMENNVTLTKTGTGSLLSVAANNSVILQDITLKGNDGNNAALVTVTGNLTMKDGSRITGNTSSVATTGGGVNITAGSVFTMDGGSIDNNSNKISNAAAQGGGVRNGGTFKMTGGTIQENTADNGTNDRGAYGGGVYNMNGTFEMSGGAIQKNKCISNKTNGTFGGGVYQSANGSSFTMSGTAKISDNEAQTGGGVAFQGTFTMTGGSIENNKSTSPDTTSPGGGGVLVYGTFNMSNGTIKGNSAAIGGGVSIQGNAIYKFNMSGGTIEGNTATSKGAAVYKGNTTGTFDKTGGIIYGIDAGDQSNKKADSVATGTTIHSIEMKASSPFYYDNTADATVNLKHVSDSNKSDNWSS